MIGNLTQFTIDLVEYIFPASCRTREERSKVRAAHGKHVRKSGLPFISFLIGVGCGAWFMRKYGLASIAIPTEVAFILTVVAWVRSRRRG